MNAAVVRRAEPASRRLALPRGADALRVPPRPGWAPAAATLLWRTLLGPVAHREAAWMPC